MSRLVFDIETNGFLEKMDCIHCIATRDVDTNEVKLYTSQYPVESPKSLVAGVAALHDADELIGHNIWAFDIPAIQKLFPEFQPSISKVTDTLIMSRLIYANLRDRDFTRKVVTGKDIGSHGLEAWGRRLGLLKGDYAKEMKAKGLDPWAEINDDMLDYCILDTEVNLKLYQMLSKAGFSERSIRLEHDVRVHCDAQEAFGCYFDEPAAVELYSTLATRRNELESRLIEVFGSWWEGEAFTPKRNNKTRGYTAGATFTKIERVEFNPASRAHIAKRLKELRGWKPKAFTPSGQPQIDESVLRPLPYPETRLLTEYLMIQKRIGQVAEGKEAWLKLAKGDRIHGRINTNGAVTGRATHSKPNLAQVPATRAPYGKDCRSLFRASPGFVLVGADASGLELRCLAHYLAHYDGGAYADIVLNGDVHTANQHAAGLPTRDDAKTFIYALLYGAGDGKIGSIIGKGPRQGKALRAKFMAAIPAYAQLSRGVKKAARDRGRIRSLDGRYLYTRSEHSALNTLLQGAGAVIMKQALVNFHDILASAGIHHGTDYRQVLWVHDEFQVECLPDLADVVGTAMVKGIQQVTQDFNLGCPLDGEYKIGPTWAETH